MQQFCSIFHCIIFLNVTRPFFLFFFARFPHLQLFKIKHSRALCQRETVMALSCLLVSAFSRVLMSSHFTLYSWKLRSCFLLSLGSLMSHTICALSPSLSISLSPCEMETGRCVLYPVVTWSEWQHGATIEHRMDTTFSVFLDTI